MTVYATIIDEVVKMNLKIASLPIPTSNEARKLRILLPDDYDQTNESYSVLYMHDGQNLFEDHLSYSGYSWRIYDTLIKMNIKDLIVVGIDNSDNRLFEYSPWSCSDEVKEMFQLSIGGLGDVYASWVVHSLKPFIDRNFRTKPDFTHTMIAGSSMGAFISVYIAATYPDIFSIIGSFSLASWFNEPVFLSYLESKEMNENQKYFISIGRNETSNPNDPKFNEKYLNNSRNLHHLLKNQGIKEILFLETDDTHNELAWSLVFPKFISFIKK